MPAIDRSGNGLPGRAAYSRARHSLTSRTTSATSLSMCACNHSREIYQAPACIYKACSGRTHHIHVLCLLLGMPAKFIIHKSKFPRLLIHDPLVFDAKLSRFEYKFIIASHFNSSSSSVALSTATVFEASVLSSTTTTGLFFGHVFCPTPATLNAKFTILNAKLIIFNRTFIT